MTYKDKWKIVEYVAKLIWAVSRLCIMIVIWLYIVDGLLHEDYMQAIAYASTFALVKLNQIKGKL
jgi:hypothetical protein